jgi:hypothetical protein
MPAERPVNLDEADLRPLLASAEELLDAMQRYADMTPAERTAAPLAAISRRNTIPLAALRVEEQFVKLGVIHDPAHGALLPPCCGESRGDVEVLHGLLRSIRGGDMRGWGQKIEGPWAGQLAEIQQDEFAALRGALAGLRRACGEEPGGGHGAIDLPLDTQQAITPGPGFSCVRWGRELFQFTLLQARIVELLWQARERGVPDVHQRELLGAAESEEANRKKPRLRDLFRNSPAWNTMIVHHPQAAKGTFRIVEPPA